MEKPNPFKNLEKETPWGEGELVGELAYIPETPEEWKNLSREIMQHHDYAAVNVTKILPLSIEGQLVADSE
jgi:hypothetical protein